MLTCLPQRTMLAFVVPTGLLSLLPRCVWSIKSSSQSCSINLTAEKIVTSWKGFWFYESYYAFFFFLTMMTRDLFQLSDEANRCAQQAQCHSPGGHWALSDLPMTSWLVTSAVFHQNCVYILLPRRRTTIASPSRRQYFRTYRQEQLAC